MSFSLCGSAVPGVPGTLVARSSAAGLAFGGGGAPGGPGPSNCAFRSRVPFLNATTEAPYVAC